jgi:hypothetical protein
VRRCGSPCKAAAEDSTAHRPMHGDRFGGLGRAGLVIALATRRSRRSGAPSAVADDRDCARGAHGRGRARGCLCPTPAVSLRGPASGGRLSGIAAASTAQHYAAGCCSRAQPRGCTTARPGKCSSERADEARCRSSSKPAEPSRSPATLALTAACLLSGGRPKHRGRLRRRADAAKSRGAAHCWFCHRQGSLEWSGRTSRRTCSGTIAGTGAVRPQA